MLWSSAHLVSAVLSFSSDQDLSSLTTTCRTIERRVLSAPSVWYARCVALQRRCARFHRDLPVSLPLDGFDAACNYRRAYMNIWRRRWLVRLTFTKQISAAEAIARVSRATGESYARTLAKVVPIGNRLMGGGDENVSQGIVFSGCWIECCRVAHEIATPDARTSDVALTASIDEDRLFRLSSDSSRCIVM